MCLIFICFIYIYIYIYNHRAIIRYVSFDILSRIRLDFFRLTSSCFLDRWSFPPFITVNDGLPNVDI